MMSMNVSVCMSIQMSAHIPMHMSTHMFIHISIHMFIRMSIHIHISIHMSMHMATHMSMHMSACLHKCPLTDRRGVAGWHRVVFWPDGTGSSFGRMAPGSSFGSQRHSCSLLFAHAHRSKQ